MRQITLLFLLLFSLHAVAQVPAVDFKYGVKLSNLSSIQQETNYDRNATGTLVAITRGSTMDWLQLIPAFTWQTKKGDFAEVSVPMWQLQRQESIRTDSIGNSVAGVNRKINLGLQYTYSIRLLKKKSTKWLPMIGFGMMPFFQNTRYSPLVETDFPYSITKGGLLFSLNPHVMWMPSPRLFLDLGLQVNAIDLSYATFYDGDPRLPLYEGHTVNWNLANGNNGIILGAGVKL